MTTREQDATIELLTDHRSVLVEGPVSTASYGSVVFATREDGTSWMINEDGRVVKEEFSSRFEFATRYEA